MSKFYIWLLYWKYRLNALFWWVLHSHTTFLLVSDVIQKSLISRNSSNLLDISAFCCLCISIIVLRKILWHHWFLNSRRNKHKFFMRMKYPSKWSIYFIVCNLIITFNIWRVFDFFFCVTRLTRTLNALYIDSLKLYPQMK